MDLWVNTEIDVYNSYWDIINANTELYSLYSSVINPTVFLYMMKTLSKFNSFKYYCCLYMSSEEKICCFLNSRYEPIIKMVIKLIINVPKSMENNFLTIFKLILKKPCHCLLSALIKIIDKLVETEHFAKLLSEYKGFYILCFYSINYTMDIKLSCLDLGRRIMSNNRYNSYNEIHSGVSLLLSSLSNNTTIPKDCSLFINESKTSIKRAKSIDSLQCIGEQLCNSETVPQITSAVNVVYDYLIDWTMKLNNNSQELIPIAWLILLHKKVKDEMMLNKIINHINSLIGKAIDLKALFRVRGIIKWLLRIEGSVYFNIISLKTYKKVIDFHTKLLIEASRDKVNGIDYFKKHVIYIQKKKIKGIDNMNLMWNKVIRHLEPTDLRFAMQFIFEFTFGIIQPVSLSTSKANKDLLFGLPIAHNPRLLSSFFFFIENFCESFIKFFPSANSLKDNFKIRDLQLMKHLKISSVFSTPQREIMPITCIFVLLSITIHQTKDQRTLKHYMSIIRPLTIYSIILLEFSKYKKENMSHKQIMSGMIFFISFLTNSLSRGSIFSDAIIQMIKLIISYIVNQQSACFELYNEIFITELKDSVNAIYKEEKNEHYLKELKAKFQKFLVFNDFINNIGVYLKNALSQSKPVDMMPTTKPKIRTLKNIIQKKELLFAKENHLMVLHLLLATEIQKRKCEHKWQKVGKAARRWQGLWRDKRVLDNVEDVSTIPYKLSSHSFTNGIRCITEIRGYTSKYLAKKGLEGFANELLKDKELCQLLSAVTSLEILKSRLIFKIFNHHSINSLIKTTINPLIEILITHTDERLKESFLIDCEIVDFFFTKPGKVCLINVNGELYLKFIYGAICFVKDRRNDNTQIFMYTHPDNKKITKKFNVRQLNKIYKKQIIDAATGIELVFTNGKVIFLKFQNEDTRENFCIKLLKSIERVYKEQSIAVIDGKKSLDKIELTRSWLNHSISNFDYLLALNQLSSRSFNNSSQYPVFPWILKLYAEISDIKSNDIYRDFSKSVGMMGDVARAESFKMKFAQTDVSEMAPCNYGSHYSSPGIVLQFMMRLFPFFEGYVEFFNGLDAPNRMFHCISEAFMTVCNDPSDLRELIPEFYCFPEMFLNLIGKNFGVREYDSQPVDNVLLPTWANSNSYTFVTMQREMLESESVSRNIQKWIDLIFGYQQRGKEAEKVSNVFPLITTEPEKILAECTVEERDDYRLQAYQWGQTPQQLFLKPHQQKDSITKFCLLCDNETMIKSFTIKTIHNKEIDLLRKTLPPSSKNNNVDSFNNILTSIVTVKIFENLPYGIKFVIITTNGEILEGLAEYFEVPGQNYTSALKFQPPKTNPYYDVSQYRVIAHRNPPLVIIKRKKAEQIIQGGYLDGSLRIISLLIPSNTSVIQTRCAAITALSVDSSEVFAVAGSAKGECLIFSVEEGLSWTFMRFLLDHKRKVNWITISDEMQLFSTTSVDGSANIYSKSFSPKLIRTIRHPKGLELNYVYFL